MITYRYSIYEDVKIFLHNKKNEGFIKNHGLYYIRWSLGAYLKLLYHHFFKRLELPNIDIDKDIVCYIVSSGTWGAYELPNKIYLCPIDMQHLPMSVEELIKHEIAHLKYEKLVKDKTHEEKEKFINDANDIS